MIRFAAPADVATLHALVAELARYERLEHEVMGTEALLRTHLFGARPYAEALVSEDGGVVVGFALFFHTYSTFRGQPGLYLEDLFVVPEHRRKGFGRALIREVARIAVDRGYGRLEWSVLRLERGGHRVLWIARRDHYERVAHLPHDRRSAEPLWARAVIARARVARARGSSLGRGRPRRDRLLHDTEGAAYALRRIDVVICPVGRRIRGGVSNEPLEA